MQITAIESNVVLRHDRVVDGVASQEEIIFSIEDATCLLEEGNQRTLRNAVNQARINDSVRRRRRIETLEMELNALKAVDRKHS